MAMRDEFPLLGSRYMGGKSDGWEYSLTFGGSTFEQTFEMLCQFLKEEGYGDIPLPSNAAELMLFRYPVRQKQILMFAESGYVHNPIKIFFVPGLRNVNKLQLFIYNEQAPNHLIRFHGVEE